MWIRAVAPVLACTIRKDTLAVLNDDAKTVVRIDVVSAEAATLLQVRPVLGYGSDAIAVGTALAAREGRNRRGGR